MDNLAQEGIARLKSGDREGARTLLRQAVRQNPNDAQAWLWLSGAVTGDVEREACLRQVLRIEPRNATALRGMEVLERRRAGSSAQASSAAPAAQRAAEPPPPTPIPAREEAPAPAMPRPVQEAQAKTPGSFRARPSQVPVLLTFWLFVAGVLVILSLLGSLPVVAWSVAGGLGALLLVVVLYAAIRNATTRYLFDGKQLNLPFRGKRTAVPVEHIYAAECNQTFFQRILATGDVLIHGMVRGELVRMRLRNIPGCRKIVGQLQSAIQETSLQHGA